MSELLPNSLRALRFLVATKPDAFGDRAGARAPHTNTVVDASLLPVCPVECSDTTSELIRALKDHEVAHAPKHLYSVLPIKS